VTAALVASDDGGPSRAAAPQPRTVTRQVTVEREATTTVQTGTEAETLPGPGGLSTDEAAALNDQAYALMQAGDWEGALPLLEQALPALQGTYSEDFRYEAYAEYNLGRTLAELDRCEDALTHLERSKELQGNRKEIVEAKKRCRKKD
jgi:tetratricopeptide (TPR) repeat protein